MRRKSVSGTQRLEANTPPAIVVSDVTLVTDLHAAEGERLYNFARHLGLSDEEAADVVQEGLCDCGASCASART